MRACASHARSLIVMRIFCTSIRGHTRAGKSRQPAWYCCCISAIRSQNCLLPAFSALTYSMIAANPPAATNPARPTGNSGMTFAAVMIIVVVVADAGWEDPLGASAVCTMSWCLPVRTRVVILSLGDDASSLTSRAVPLPSAAENGPDIICFGISSFIVKSPECAAAAVVPFPLPEE